MIIYSDEYYTYERALNILQIMKMYYDQSGDKSIFKKIDIHTSDYNGSWGTLYPLDVCMDIINEIYENVKIFTPAYKFEEKYSAYLESCLAYTKKVDMSHLKNYPINTENAQTDYIKFIEDLLYTSRLIFIEGSTKYNPYFINLQKTYGVYGEFILAEGINKDCFCIIIDEDYLYSNMENLVEFLLRSKEIIEIEDGNQ